MNVLEMGSLTAMAASAETAVLHAMAEEGIHFFAVLGGEPGVGTRRMPSPDGVRAHAAASVGAAIGDAKRLLRERGNAVGEVVCRLATMADGLERNLPHRLYLLWRMHFVDGRALEEYAAATGRTTTVAKSNYRDLVQTLATMAAEVVADEIAQCATQTLLVLEVTRMLTPLRSSPEGYDYERAT